METFGSDMSNHWGIVDFHDPVAEFARESLDTIMEVKVASADKSEERRKDREAIQEKKKLLWSWIERSQSFDLNPKTNEML